MTRLVARWAPFAARAVLLAMLVAFGIVTEHGRIHYLKARAGPEVDVSHLALGKYMAVAVSETAPSGQAVLIGDSIAEMAWIDTLCGRTVENFAIGGSRVEHWRDIAPRLAANLRPQIVVIALGTNDAQAAALPDYALWQTNYRKLIAAFAGARIILVPPPRVESGKPLGPPFMSLQRLRLERGFIASLARGGGGGGG